MRSLIKKHILVFYFIAIFIGLFFFFGFHNIISFGPTSTHAWRQSDSYAFALSYFYEDNNLLQPSILFVGESGHGRTVSEFPILYYITAKIWKITGPTPAVLKFINFSILLLGLYHLALLSKQLLKDNFWSLFVVIALFSSPLLGYYSFNFTPNTPAFGMALSGIFFMYLFGLTRKNKYLVFFTLFFTFASLIKVTALFTFLGGLTLLTLYYLEDLKKHKSQLIKILLASFLIFTTYLVWYKYSIAYNNSNLKGIFNQSIMPIWRLDAEKIRTISKEFYFNVFPQYYNNYAFYFIVLLIIVILVFYKKFNKHARRITIIYFFGLLAFATIFFQGLNKHDYFLTNTLIIIPAVIITVILTLKRYTPSAFNSRILKVCSGIIILLPLNYSMIQTRMHYNPKSMLVSYNFPQRKAHKDFWDYNYHIIKYTDFQYMGIENYFREIGIAYNNKVISIGDYTPNKTLCLMHQRGFTEYHYSWNYKEENMIERMKELGAEYVITCGKKHEKRQYLKQYLSNKIGQFNDVSIYKLPQ